MKNSWTGLLWALEVVEKQLRWPASKQRRLMLAPSGWSGMNCLCLREERTEFYSADTSYQLWSWVHPNKSGIRLLSIEWHAPTGKNSPENSLSAPRALIDGLYNSWKHHDSLGWLWGWQGVLRLQDAEWPASFIGKGMARTCVGRLMARRNSLLWICDGYHSIAWKWLAFVM